MNKLKSALGPTDLVGVLEPTMAEQARTILNESIFGSMATIDVDGRPVVSPVPIVSDGSGAPVTVLSNLSTHAGRALHDRRASMSVGDRVLIQGDLDVVPGLQQHELTPAFTYSHPELMAQVESLDFSWWRLVPQRVRFIDERGSERWLRADDLAGAEPDPLTALGPNMVAEVNETLGANLLLMAKALGGRWLATDAVLTAVDRYGLTVLVSEPGSQRPSRIPFPVRIDKPEELHASVAALLRAAEVAPSEQPAAQLIVTERRPSDGPSASSLLDAIESDTGSRSHVEGIDRPAHGDPDTPVGGSLFDSLENANGQSWSLCTEDDGDLFVPVDFEAGEIVGLDAGSESEDTEALGPDDFESFGKRLRTAIGHEVSLTHADTPAAPVEGVTTSGVEEESVDPEPSSTAQDDAEIRGVVDPFDDYESLDLGPVDAGASENL